MSRLLEKVVPMAAGAGAIGLLDFLLVEGAGSVGVGYDLLNEGYLADFLKTRNPAELLDLHELNVGEVVSLLAIIASLSLLFFALGGRRANSKTA